MRSNETRKVLTYGTRILRQKAKAVTEFEGMEQLGRQMLEEMHRSHGVGLAAPQIGISQRIIVADASSFDATQEPVILINPEIVERQGEEFGIEGCLSLPGIEVEVRRSKEIRVKAQATDGKPLELRFENFPARIIQHEVDHLNGTLILDYLPPLEKVRAIWKLRKRGWRSDPEFVREKDQAAL